MNLEKLLTPLETRDATLLQIRDEAARMLLETPTVDAMGDFSLYIVADFDRLEPQHRDRLYTDAAIALTDERAIVINERFMHEAEIAVRAFGLSGSILLTPYVRSDEFIFDFVRRMTTAPSRYLGFLREIADTAMERRAILETAMAMVFFIAHELGHLHEGEDEGQFGSFIHPHRALETSLAIATLKFSAHHKELSELGFTLSKEPPNEAREIAAAARRTIETLPENDCVNQSVWFQREAAADEYATKILLECLDRSPVTDDPTPCYVLAMRGLFAVAISSWYKDLLIFIEKLAGPAVSPRAGVLQLCMTKSREQYIRASSLFGENHRFTLLRAVLAIGQIVSSREGSSSERVPGYADAFQRYVFLGILMDTAVKLAFIGSATPWMLAKDAQRGTPQLFMINFFNIGEELQRLKRTLRID